MDAVRNPFAPGAGTPPPELAGRDAVVSDADVAIQRLLQSRPSRSLVLLGLRGVGKTVLLNEIERLAEQRQALTSFIEAPETNRIADLLFPLLNRLVRRLSLIEGAKAGAHAAMRALASFARTFRVKVEGIELSVDPEPGAADTGDLQSDLPELLVRVGEAARAGGRGWVLLIDEVQYLRQDDLSALVVGLHRCGQRRLPVLFFGAGLPQLAGLLGEAKSYAERLFAYPTVGPLDDVEAARAIREPIEAEGEAIAADALTEIVAGTQGYPYFLQEWGYQAWNMAKASPISVADVRLAAREAIHRLDQGFFRVRFDRLTPKEREYVQAMARLGPGPTYRSSEVADALGVKVQSLAPRRADIIRKGMIFSPAHGDIAFTVPLFDAFLRRMDRAA